MTKTESYIYRPKSSIYFCSFTDYSLRDAPKNWRPPVYDYSEVSPDSLYLVFPDGTVLSYKTETAVRYGVLGLPDCKTDFTEDSPCVIALLRHGKYKVWIHERVCYVYTPVEFQKLLEKAGHKSLNRQLAYIKSQIGEARQKKKIAETLTEQFSRGLK